MTMMRLGLPLSRRATSSALPLAALRKNYKETNGKIQRLYCLTTTIGKTNSKSHRVSSLSLWNQSEWSSRKSSNKDTGSFNIDNGNCMYNILGSNTGMFVEQAWNNKRNMSTSAGGGGRIQDDDTTTFVSNPTSSTSSMELNNNNINENADSIPSFDETMAKLLEQDQAATAAESASSTAAEAAAIWDPVWYYPGDHALNILLEFQNMSGFTYGASIICVTCIFRTFMFPFFVLAQRNSSRMAHMHPEMKALQLRYDQGRTKLSQEEQIQLGLQMRALFTKYGCNPFYTIAVFFVQAPVFMGMFFALRKMPDYYGTELANSSIFWITDLVAPDPFYILPVASAATFLLSIELGKDTLVQSNPKQGRIMLNVFRSMAIVMVPVISSFSSALNLYWLTNNTITMVQSTAFRQAAIRKALGIWDLPKPAPGVAQAKGIIDTIRETVNPPKSDQQRMKEHNESIDDQKMAKAASLSSIAQEEEEEDDSPRVRRKKFRTKKRR